MYLLTKVIATMALLAITTGLTACATTSSDRSVLVAEPPKNEAFRTELKKELSSLNIPIQTSSDDLSNTLNRLVPVALYKGSTRTKGLSVDILRNAPVSVSAADNYIYLTLPVSMTLKLGFFQAPPISTSLKFKLNASVTPDWRLKAEVYYMGLSDLLSENAGVGPLSVNLRSIVDGVTQPVQRILADLIIRRLNEKFPLKEQVTKAWNAAQKPILLDKNYNAWLRMKLQEVLLDPLYANNNQIKLNIGIKSFADLVVGPAPPALPLVPLPDLKLVNGMDKTFRVALNTDLFYKDIVTIASPLLLNRELGSDGKSIIIEEFDLYGSGEHLMIKLTMKGTVEGTFYLTCRPAFNLQSNTFSVEDVEFEMETQSLLLKSANWLLHGTIRSIIQEKLNMNLTERLEKTRAIAGKAMEQVKLADNIYLTGNINTMKLNDVMLQKDKLSIQVYAEGETAIVFR